MTVEELADLTPGSKVTAEPRRGGTEQDATQEAEQKSASDAVYLGEEACAIRAPARIRSCLFALPPSVPGGFSVQRGYPAGTP
jgi:hypothetical protein